MHDEREKLLREVSEKISFNKPQLHNQRVTHEEVHRKVVQSKIKLD